MVGKAADGETLAAVGRNDTGDWVRVARADLPGGEGWVAAAYVVLDQPIDRHGLDIASPFRLDPRQRK